MTIEPDPTTRATLETISKCWTRTTGQQFSPEIVGRMLLAGAARTEYVKLHAEQEAAKKQEATQ